MPSRSADGAKTLERGLRLLRVLAANAQPVSVSALARELETNRAAVYRLLGPLVEHRLVTRDGRGGAALGVGLLELARRVRVELCEVAIPHLRQLADDLVVTAALTVLDGEDAVVAAVAEPSHSPMHVAYRVGSRHPLNRGASGLAILAGRPRAPRERREIAQARLQGYASSAGELQPGAYGVSAPILVPSQETVASLSVISLTPLNQDAAAERLRAATEAIAAMLA
jgi:DNA-binding IclR family transcriptional regulator